MWLFGVRFGTDPDTPCRRRRNQKGDRPGRVDRRPRPRARQATVVAYKYVGLSRGVLLADDAALTEIDGALQVAERSSEDIAVGPCPVSGWDRAHLPRRRRPSAGIQRAAELRDMCAKQRYALNAVP
jgi:hypothetical protein